MPISNINPVISSECLKQNTPVISSQGVTQKNGSLETYYQQFVALEATTATQLSHAKPDSFEFNELSKLLQYSVEGAHILKDAITKHNGQLSHHERDHLTRLMNQVNVQCWTIRDNSTSGQLPPLYWSMVDCFWTCNNALKA